MEKSLHQLGNSSPYVIYCIIVNQLEIFSGEFFLLRLCLLSRRSFISTVIIVVAVIFHRFFFIFGIRQKASEKKTLNKQSSRLEEVS